LTFYKSDKEKYFEIEVVKNSRHERYIITLNQLRIDNKDQLTDGEGEYWFDYKISAKQVFSFSMLHNLAQLE
jgi:hypothetical protein